VISGCDTGECRAVTHHKPDINPQELSIKTEAPQYQHRLLSSTMKDREERSQENEEEHLRSKMRPMIITSSSTQ
jgi:hypothetical protein